MKKVFKFRIELEGTSPTIWREFLAPSDTTFYRFHHIIQIVMGWENYHLYEFTMDSYRIGQQFEEEGFNGPNEIIDSKTITIGEVLQAKGQKLEYLYDFGDYWQHSLTLEMIIDDLTIPFPICCAGALNCPPEDVGSIPGFYDFLKIMENPRHPEHKETKTWVNSKLVAIDGRYDPQKIPLERVNYVLLNLDNYIKDWEKEANQ
ncbi:plasmid pRiA4b ORF-3 family protein [Flagellimonas sediminis]|uniref:Plasmid pRiA4b ORF-3 family protein n=1 Tax=Flagellimonas sediminis TaxID=2696468 RepID=A0A6I5KQN3_9FLAO|nr:plasmid pRiA4b ORF-3 family protein [Allomuricauda sediminis]NDV43076.1 plasmid pRiA4b ORF-3 family protein [Allomuricauda sediminis]